MSIHAQVNTTPQVLHHEILPGKFLLHQLALANPQRYPFLLESTARLASSDDPSPQYDILFAFPQSSLIKHADNTLSWDNQTVETTEFLPALDRLFQEHALTKTVLPALPFTGGWFVYLSYELSVEIEPRLRLPVAPTALPIAQATRIPAAIIYNHSQNTTHIVAEPACAQHLAEMKTDLLALHPANMMKPAMPEILLEEAPGEEYQRHVTQILEYIRAGDIYQVNVSRAWRGHCEDEKIVAAIYSRLRQCNPAPFAGLMMLNNGAIMSSSPERLVRTRQQHIETRPIAGTRPRGDTNNPDQILQQELLSHPKERAEHIMLLDLERNDLGRICESGSVHVDALMQLESYAHVHHIVSNVSGKLRPAITPAEIIRAVFPGGTITGCPKVRCMEIIAELEQTPRGAYTGSFGYLNHHGDMDLNILIRSIVLDGAELTIRTGAGIVADSVPQRELDETRTKAKGMLAAIMEVK